MPSLLIVDDESAIIEDIMATLSTAPIGIDCIYRANSGTKAIEIIKQHPVHIVITDIRMPGMDGIELVKTIKDRWKHIKCILLSGYAEFAYAQEAIRQEVVDYLLKPIMDEKLLATVRATSQMIEEEQKELIFHSKVENTLKENRSSLQQNLLRDLLGGKRLATDELSDILQLYEIPDMTNETYVAMIASFPEDKKWEQENLLEYAVANIAQELFKDFYLWSACKNNLLVTLVFLKPEVRRKNPSFICEPPAFEKMVERLAAQLQESVKFYLSVSLSFLLSGADVFPYNIPAVYRSTLSSFTKQNRNRVQAQTTDTAQQIQPRIILHESPSFIHLFEEDRWDLIDEKLINIFRELKNNPGYSREHILEVYFIISNTLIYFIHRNGSFLSDALSENAEDFMRRLPFLSIERFESWTLGIVVRIKEMMSVQRRKNHASIIQQVHDYIAKHVDTDVSLQTIADHVYLHPVYLSKIFKLETGEGLSEYVQRVRMEKAAYMLSHTNEKIYGISEKVGLQDPSYFIRVFKKYFGVTPQQYRNGTVLHS